MFYKNLCPELFLIRNILLQVLKHHAVEAYGGMEVKYFYELFKDA
jgi:hypothetical protein